MTPQPPPALSVILLAASSATPLARVLGCLQAQSLQSGIEIVIVAPHREALVLAAGQVEGFHSLQVVETGPIRAIGPAYAAGVRSAHAAVVAFGEDHSFPDAGWAEALLEAHGERIAAVGPAVRNANPFNAVSWADLLIAYAPWLDPAPAGEAAFLPGHNSSYRREVLLACGERLEELLENETLLHWELRRRGLRLRLQPRAVTAHTNFGQLFPWLPVQFRCGRLFAAGRCEGWPLPSRLLYAAAAPLIPPLRLWRIGRELARPERRSLRLPAGSLWLVLLGLAADGLGQLVGAALGPGDAARGFAEAEFSRDRWLGSSASPAATAQLPRC
ncbi:MAG: hypothetical protein VKO00_11655 [Cyanobacteriota bacterium]|nr:hypothetical protein [Cyanobacteriota bacterium]